MILINQIKNPLYAIKKEEPKPYNFKKTGWFKWTTATLKLLFSIGISFASEALNAVLPGVGLALDYGLNMLLDFAFNLYENDGKIDLQDFLFDLGLNSIPFFLKGMRRFSNFVKNSKPLSILENIDLGNSKLKKELSQNFWKASSFGTTKDIATTPNYTRLQDSFKLFDNQMTELKSLNFNKVKIDFDYKQMASKLKKASKTIHNAKVIATLITSPRYAARKAAELVTKKPFDYLQNKWAKWIDKKIPKKFVKTANKTVEEAQKSIPLNSSWLNRLKIYKAYNPWNQSFVNAVVSFQPKATNNKKPVLLVQKNLSVVLGLLNDKSPGQYYLNNFAWGWEIGAFLRNHKNFLAKSKIPLFVTFLSNFNYVFKSIEFIAKSIQNLHYGNVLGDLKQGLLEGITKLPDFKYINPLTSAAKSAVQGNPYFVIKKGLDIGHKYNWSNKISKKLNAHKVVRKGVKW